jgi:hypothetical protein
LKRNAVTSAKVRNHSLRRSDFAAGTLLRGLQGTPGASGAPGAQGERGPSDAFAASFPDSTGPWAATRLISPPPTKLAELKLDPGNYLAWATFIVFNGNDHQRAARCGLGTPGISGYSDESHATDVAEVQLAPQDASSSSRQTVTLIGPVRLPEADTVTVHCGAGGVPGGTGELQYSDVDIGAIEVGSLHAG